jgi:hypothetical protein
MVIAAIILGVGETTPNGLECIFASGLSETILALSSSE